MDRLIEGVAQFRGTIFPEKSVRFEELARDGQAPRTLMISCSDSRVVPELITQSEPGELFVCRNAGNIVPPWQRRPDSVTSAIEFAVVGLGVTDIVICGHSNCGAMKGLMNPDSLKDMPSVAEWLVHSEAAGRTVQACCGGLSEGQRLTALVEENVIAQLLHLRSHPSVAAALAKGRIRLHGWVFDIPTGAIRALDAKSGQFLEVGEDGALPVADFGSLTRRMAEAA